MVTALLFFGLPLVATAVSLAIASRRHDSRLWYLAIAVTLSAVVVAFGSVLWFSNGCADDSEQCSAAAGWSLLGLDLLLVVGLAAIVVAAGYVARRR
ncbi:MAG: hypothetical protein AB7V58_06905 [Solirubrobacterales bacterium]